MKISLKKCRTCYKDIETRIMRFGSTRSDNRQAAISDHGVLFSLDIDGTYTHQGHSKVWFCNECWEKIIGAKL